jgi:hypothetical protein
MVYLAALWITAAARPLGAGRTLLLSRLLSRPGLPLLLSRPSLGLEGGAIGTMFIQIDAVIELLPTTIAFQLVLNLHVESPFHQAVGVAARCSHAKCNHKTVALQHTPMERNWQWMHFLGLQPALTRRE